MVAEEVPSTRARREVRTARAVKGTGATCRLCDSPATLRCDHALDGPDHALAITMTSEGMAPPFRTAAVSYAPTTLTVPSPLGSKIAHRASNPHRPFPDRAQREAHTWIVRAGQAAFGTAFLALPVSAG